tara:strand:+ start:4351 stop:4806 length:456 start_codon:yes stop_codon:yes gene_type:complete
MFNFDPNDVDDSNFECLPNGEYDCRVESVEAKVSKAGNQMLELGVNVYRTNDVVAVRCFDYIVNPSGLWKLKSICRCCDWDFNDGKIDEQLIVGKQFRVKVKLIPATEQYPEKNQIVRYVSALNSTAVTTPTSPSESGTIKTATTEDVVPF